MYGDSDLIRRRVSQLRDQGADVRALADELVARTAALGWSGRAAEAMHDRVAERAAHLRSAADRHAGAADALEAHAGSVEAVKDEIAAVEKRAARLVEEARTRIARIATRNDAGGGPPVTPTPEDERLVATVWPPPGHRDWLTVELPRAER